MLLSKAFGEYVTLDIFGSSTAEDKYYAPQVPTAGVRTHDLQIMTVHFMSLRCLL